ncbi:MAG: ABC transporter ATP-binding protein [Halopseudomonas sp.]
MNCCQREPLLSARQLNKTFGNRSLFTIDSLELYAGEATLLTGRNGAGKSTLLKIIAGLETPDGGTLSYRGKQLNRRQHRNIGGKVIYLHQQPFLFDCSVEDNVGYGIKKRSDNRQALRVAQALEWSGLSHLAQRNAKTLSGGEKQRIALARAWVMEPELLLLDEPTANMDAESREQTLFLIRRLINEGMGIVLCSHEFKTDNRLIKRELKLDQGQLQQRVWDRSPEPPRNVTPTASQLLRLTEA